MKIQDLLNKFKKNKSPAFSNGANVTWKFFTKSEEAWQAMINACDKAQKTICIEQYIIENDEVGRELLEILKRKAREGLDIKILCDTAGSYSFYNSALPAELSSIGINVRFFNIISPWRVRNFTSWFFRDHRKILVIDSKVAFVGGVGFRNDMRNWRDTHLEITGEIIPLVEEAFNQMWEKAEKKIFFRFKKQKHFIKGWGFITNSPRFKQRFIYHRLISAIRNAKTYIHLSTPYFIPDHRLLRILRLAAKRKIDVKIILPEKSDVRIADLASRSYFHTLLKSGVKIYLYKDNVMHAKTAVVDGSWATVGSFNLDNLSFVFNYEANIASENKKFVSELESQFSKDMEKCKEVNLEEFEKRSFLEKIKEFFVKMIRSFL